MLLRILLAALLASTGVSAQTTYKGLTIAPEADRSTYNRSDWGKWIDADGDKERTRVEVLITESLVPAVLDTSGRYTKVVSGLWVGPYCGFVSTDPNKIQIDHMVPLGEAHDSGAATWSKTKKADYYNTITDTQHLIATKGGCNGSKGAKDPAEWMPPNRTYWCKYLNDWVAIKKKWALTVDQAEVDALKVGFRVCAKYKSGDKLEGRH